MFFAVETGDDQYEFELLKAIENENVSQVEKLLGRPYHADPNFKIGEKSMLIYAVETGNMTIASMLVDAGADLNDELVWLIRSARMFDRYLVQRLLNLRADINYVSCHQYTPLAAACEGSDRRAVKFLLDARADPNFMEENRSPLAEAATLPYGKPIIEMLLQADAEVDIIDFYGITPLALACASGHAENVKLLLASKADPNYYGRDQVIAINEAMSLGSDGEHIVQILLDAGAIPTDE